MWQPFLNLPDQIIFLLLLKNIFYPDFGPFFPVVISNDLNYIYGR